ncbi:DUF397 domain-containing protein [Streptomyces sp. NPDC049954]|uniref:DUF397 domain-containing protein n=1 Tax=Streptomyces sp. NPDC049954 TaxID=3155779 RepID=UPI0034191D2E
MNESRKAAFLPVAWRKSSYSNGGGECVKVGFGLPHTVPVRDSKVANGPAVVVSREAFAALINAA